MSRLPSLGPRGEGWVALQGVLFVLIAAAAVSVPGDAGRWSGVLTVVGTGLVAAGATIALSAIVVLRSGRALTAVPHPPAGARLVTGGPYRWVRHPIYAGIVIGSFGAATFRASIPAFLAAVALLVFFDLKRRREEAWLRERIDGYDAYAARTRALLPGLY